MSDKKRVVAAGLALFAMFFGAGDLIWPLILGGKAGSQVWYALAGFIITGVSLPLLGLVSMMLFEGNYRAFFGRVGVKASFLLIFIIQSILGPIGSIPRLVTLAHATLQPYLPDTSLLLFSFVSSAAVFALAFKKSRIIDLLGLVLTPILLICLIGIVGLGLYHLPEAPVMTKPAFSVFKEGLSDGYNTLDLIASFIFAPLVLSHFVQAPVKGQSEKEAKKELFKKMLQACFIAASLMALMFVSLAVISAHYSPILSAKYAPEAFLGGLSYHLLGPAGALISCTAIALICLTTAIPLVSIAAEYTKENFFPKETKDIVPMMLILVISSAIANIGFMGIASLLSPILQILCPGLIALAVFNTLHKLYEVQLTKLPFYIAFGASATMHYVTRFL